MRSPDWAWAATAETAAGKSGTNCDVGALDFCGEAFGGYAGDGLLAGGVDGEDADGVGVSECAGELVHKVEGTGVAVGLEDDVNLAVAALAGGGKGGANLGGVMAVVVDDGDAAGGAAKLKAPVDAAEVTEALGNFVGGNFKLAGDGDGGGGVEHIVASGNVELEGAEGAGDGVDEEAGEANFE